VPRLPLSGDPQTDNPEPLAVLLLPCRLEDFELESHARNLLAIPRVLAVEPSRHRTPRWLREGIALRHAKRLRFPGRPRAVVLYDPRSYLLARALLGRYPEAELWYVPPDRAALHAAAQREDADLIEFDRYARSRADQLLPVTPDGDPRVENEPLRARLLELEVISHRPFIPALRATRPG
jgi:hypothetical protein